MLTEHRTGTGQRLDVLSLIDQLQDLVESSPRVPLSDRTLISSDELLDLLDAIRNTLPHDLIEAERLLIEKHRLLEDARDEADHLLESAREQSKFMLQEHHVIKAAEIRAERLVNQAQREADEIMQSADDYVQRLFKHFEGEAERLADEIRRAAAHRA